MTFPNGFRIAASSACLVILTGGCHASYTPELELLPALPDGAASITAYTAYDAASVADSGGFAPVDYGNSGGGNTPGGRGDSGGPLAPPQQGQQPSPQFGVDASATTGPIFGPGAVFDSGTVVVNKPDAAPHEPPDAGTPRPHALTVVVTTVDDGQGYSPANVGAIWVAQSSGAFVQTLQVWAKTRIDHLVLWNSVTKAAGLSRNTVDAITGASEYAFGTHVVYWNFTDTTGKVMPDGTYRVYFETADWNATGPNTFVTFTKGPTAATTTFPDTPSFIDLKTVMMP